MKTTLRSADEALDLAISLGPNPYREVSLDFENSANLRYFDDKKLHEGGNIMRRLEEGVAIFVDNDYLIHSFRSIGMSIEIPGIYRIAAQFEAFQAKQPVTYKIIAKRPRCDASLSKVGDIEAGEKTSCQVAGCALMEEHRKTRVKWMKLDGREMLQHLLDQQDRLSTALPACSTASRRRYSSSIAAVAVAPQRVAPRSRTWIRPSRSRTPPAALTWTVAESWSRPLRIDPGAVQANV